MRPDKRPEWWLDLQDMLRRKASQRGIRVVVMPSKYLVQMPVDIEAAKKLAKIST